MTDLLAELRAALAKTTQGKWELTTYAPECEQAGWPCAIYGLNEDDPDGDPTTLLADFDDVCDEDISKEVALANALFTTLIHNRLPELLDRLEKAEKELDGAWEFVGDLLHDNLTWDDRNDVEAEFLARHEADQG